MNLDFEIWRRDVLDFDRNRADPAGDESEANHDSE